MNETDISELGKIIARLSMPAIQSLLADKPEETFFALALSNIDDASYVSLCMNSDVNHYNVINQLHDGKGPPDSNEELYYKWSPCEWGDYEFISPNSFTEADKCIESMHHKYSDEHFPAYRSGVYQAMILGLKIIKETMRSSHKNPLPLMYISLTDSFDAAKMARESSLAINDQHALLPEFLHAISDW